jgi:exopolyphosphatase/guanosine-5'-triphosphate,3'-diphosphate pyrophosphatase
VHSELVGFSQRELSIVANVVRYHNGSKPKKKHGDFARLRPNDREVVRKLAAILTLAAALDRSGRVAVAEIGISVENGTVHFEVTPASDCHIEMWDARRKAPAFERVFGVKTLFTPAAETGDPGAVRR